MWTPELVFSVTALVFAAISLFFSAISLYLTFRKHNFDIDKSCSEDIAKICADLEAAIQRISDFRVQSEKKLTSPYISTRAKNEFNDILARVPDLTEAIETCQGLVTRDRNPMRLAKLKSIAKECVKGVDKRLTRYESMIDQLISLSTKPDAEDAEQRD